MNVATAFQRIRQIEQELDEFEEAIMDWEDQTRLFIPFQDLEQQILGKIPIGNLGSLNREEGKKPFLFLIDRKGEKQCHLTTKKLTMVFADQEVDIQSQSELDHFVKFWSIS